MDSSEATTNIKILPLLTTANTSKQLQELRGFKTDATPLLSNCCYFVKISCHFSKTADLMLATVSQVNKSV